MYTIYFISISILCEHVSILRSELAGLIYNISLQCLLIFLPLLSFSFCLSLSFSCSLSLFLRVSVCSNWTVRCAVHCAQDRIQSRGWQATFERRRNGQSNVAARPCKYAFEIVAKIYKPRHSLNKIDWPLGSAFQSNFAFVLCTRACNLTQRDDRWWGVRLPIASSSQFSSSDYNRTPTLSISSSPCALYLHRLHRCDKRKKRN